MVGASRIARGPNLAPGLPDVPSSVGAPTIATSAPLAARLSSSAHSLGAVERPANADVVLEVVRSRTRRTRPRCAARSARSGSRVHHVSTMSTGTLPDSSGRHVMGGAATLRARVACAHGLGPADRPLRAQHGRELPEAGHGRRGDVQPVRPRAPAEPGVPRRRRARALPGVPRVVRLPRGGPRLPASRARVRRRRAGRPRRAAVPRERLGGARGAHRVRGRAAPRDHGADRRRPARRAVPAEPDHVPDDDRVEGGPVRARRRTAATSSTSRSGGRRGSTPRSRVARCTAIVGFAATSNVEAARRFGLRPTGTMAHSYVESFPSEADAFRTFARDFPERTTFLVDTYDTLNGVLTAIQVIRELELGGDARHPARQRRPARPRHGEPASCWTRRAFPACGSSRAAGWTSIEIERLVRAGAPIDAFGVGTRVGVSADAPIARLRVQARRVRRSPDDQALRGQGDRARTQAGVPLDERRH